MNSVLHFPCLQLPIVPFLVLICCFLTCTQVSQETDNVVWYSHLFKNFPQFVVIHTDKGFSTVTEAEADVFLEFSYFLYNPMDVGNLISGSSVFSKSLQGSPRGDVVAWGLHYLLPDIAGNVFHSQYEQGSQQEEMYSKQRMLHPSSPHYNP